MIHKILTFLGIKSKMEQSEPSKYANCDIEYMPTIDKYFPRYKGKYLRFSHVTELFVSFHDKDLLCVCRYGKTEEEAREYLDRFLEQMITKNEIIKIK